MPHRISVESTEYLKVPVSVDENGVPYDPTGDPVEMAFVLNGVSLDDSTWESATWETTDEEGTFMARCLVGPSGDVPLTAGQYSVWLRIHDQPEVPVRRVGTLVVY